MLHTCLQRSLSKQTFLLIPNLNEIMPLNTGTRQQSELFVFMVCKLGSLLRYLQNLLCNMEQKKAAVLILPSVWSHCRWVGACRCYADLSHCMWCLGSLWQQFLSSLDSDKNSQRSSLKVHFYLIPEFSFLFILHCESQRILHFYSSRTCCRSYILVTKCATKNLKYVL